MASVNISNHPLIQHRLTSLRDVATESPAFRQLVFQLSSLLCYEAMQDFPTAVTTVETPMGQAVGARLQSKLGLVPILRAGLGMVDGFLSLVPEAQVWHIGLYRDEETLTPVEYYNKLPEQPTVQTVLILDPMLATGGSAIATADIIKQWGVTDVRFVGLIAAPEGVQALNNAHPDIPIYVGAVDEHLNDIGFIVPGLGDAGDRQFGTT